MLERVAVWRGFWGIVKEGARHVLRRPVVGVVASARTRDGRWVLVRRGDTGDWALPGGTLDWGETLRSAIARELLEETGCEVLELGRLVGVFSEAWRDARFHAVTVVVEALVAPPERPPANALEVREVGLFHEQELPERLSFGMADMLAAARSKSTAWQ
jgi:8-oxo-dGTP diphosphatase